jgi:hypothetical protein
MPTRRALLAQQMRPSPALPLLSVLAFLPLLVTPLPVLPASVLPLLPALVFPLVLVLALPQLLAALPQTALHHVQQVVGSQKQQLGQQGPKSALAHMRLGCALRPACSARFDMLHSVSTRFATSLMCLRIYGSRYYTYTLET